MFEDIFVPKIEEEYFKTKFIFCKMNHQLRIQSYNLLSDLELI